MGLISWLSKKLSKDIVPLSGTELDDALSEIYTEVHIREMAFWNTVNIISNAVSKCEFKTYVKGKEVKGPEYYLWNVEPNKNQNSSEFIHKWLAQLYRNNEYLIIENDKQLLVADSFVKKEYALYEDEFTEVTVKDFTFNKTFKQSEVLYGKLSEKNMRQVINALYASYSKLIFYSMKAYGKSRGTKGIFKYETLPVAGTDERKFFDELVNKKFKTFMDSGDAILPLGRGQEYDDIDSKTYSSESTRDIRAQIDDISDFTAKGFSMPPAITRGDVQDTSKAVDQMLTFCIDPLVDGLQEEINRKRIGQIDYLKGSKIKIDTSVIKHINIFDVSTGMDKLIASGTFSVNEILKKIGEEPINEEWADKHFITKNYTDLEEYLANLQT